MGSFQPVTTSDNNYDMGELWMIADDDLANHRADGRRAAAVQPGRRSRHVAEQRPGPDLEQAT